MKKITKIGAIISIYLIMSVSLIGVVSATTTETGTLTQTVSAGTDYIIVPSTYLTTFASPSSGGSTSLENWDDVVEWGVLSGATNADVLVQTDQDLTGLTYSQTMTAQVKSDSTPATGGTGAINTDCSWGSGTTTQADMTTQRTLTSATGCTALSGSWTQTPQTNVIYNDNQAADTYTATITGTISTY